MNVYLGDNSTDLIPNDILVSWILRSDLAPVPRTVEFIVQNKDGIDKKLVEGSFFWSGYENLKYRIIKVVKSASTGAIQGDSAMQLFTVFAVLSDFAEICFRRNRAAILRNTSLGEMYMACGAKVSIESDISIPDFACGVGQVPSYAIAKILQEQSAHIVLRNKKLSIVRIVDIFGQADTTDKIDSQFQERHEIPSFYSVDDSGSIIKGNFDDTRQIQYIPKKTTEELYNMTKVLVTRRVIDSDMEQRYNAGDLITVNDKNYAIITAAHYTYRYDGVAMTGSKFWVGDLSV